MLCIIIISEIPEHRRSTALSILIKPRRQSRLVVASVSRFDNTSFSAGDLASHFIVENVSNNELN